MTLTHSEANWRLAVPSDDAVIGTLSAALNQEDPGPAPVPAEHMERTLLMLRNEPWRGRAVVLEDADVVSGYALLISFWSNELGGEVCTVDELYIAPHARGRGLGTRLFELALSGQLWSRSAVALALETTPDNERARRLYERLGFTGHNIAMRRRRPG